MAFVEAVEVVGGKTQKIQAKAPALARALGAEPPSMVSKSMLVCTKRRGMKMV